MSKNRSKARECDTLRSLPFNINASCCFGLRTDWDAGIVGSSIKHSKHRTMNIPTRFSCLGYSPGRTLCQVEWSWCLVSGGFALGARKPDGTLGAVVLVSPYQKLGRFLNPSLDDRCTCLGMQPNSSGSAPPVSINIFPDRSIKSRTIMFCQMSL